MEIPGALWRNMIFKYSGLQSNAKLVGCYLSTWMDEHGNNCYPSVKRIAEETSLSEVTVCKYIAELRDNGWLTSIKYGYDGQQWARNQYYPQIPELHIVEFTRHLSRFSGSQKGTKAPLVRHLNSGGKALKELNTSKSVTKSVTKSGGRFTPPTVKEVKEYCDSRNNGIDPQNFIDHYETNGWMRGKNKIKDWKACVRTWEKNNKPKPDYDPLEDWV